MNKTIKKRAIVMLKALDEVGEIGDTVSVSRGYARNYLIPRGYAISDSKYARDLLKSRHKAIAHTRAQRKSQAEEQKALIEQEPCHISMRTSETGKLFGSVTTHLVTEELAKRSIHISTKAVRIPHHRITAVGEYSVPIHLHDDVIATLSLQVEKQE